MKHQPHRSLRRAAHAPPAAAPRPRDLWLTRLAALVLLAQVATVGAQSAPSTAAPLPITHDRDLASFVDDLMADHLVRFELAGAAVTIVQDGEIAFSKGYGHADVDAGVPVDPARTLFSTASVAKLYTWTAIMQLVERGELHLDDDVNDHLIGLRIPTAFDEPVRIWHLLSHTAGFEDSPVIGLVTAAAEDVPDLATALARWRPERVRPPGTVTAYNNYGTALAAHIVATVSGMPWEDYVEQRILQPLGMTRSSPRQPVPVHLAPDVATSYHRDAEGFVETPFEYVTIGPAGGTVSTTEDMARFMIAHLQEGRYHDIRILEEGTARQMHTRLFANDARIPGNAHGFWEAEAHGERVLLHAGDTSSYTLLVLVPERDVGFYVAYNSPDGGAREAFQTAFLDHLFRADEAPPTGDVAAGAIDLDALTGTFGDTRLSASTMAKLLGLFATMRVSTEDGGLVTDVVGGGQKRWRPVAPLVFAEVGGRDRLVFRTDDQGRASHVFFADLPVVTFATTPWYDRLELHAVLLLTFLVALLTALVAWPFYGRRRDVTQAPPPIGRRFMRRLPAVAGLLYTLFLVLLALALLDFSSIELGVTPLLGGALVVAMVAAVLTLVSLAGLVAGWRTSTWSTVERVHYAFVVLACATLTWQLHHWNLLGIRT